MPGTKEKAGIFASLKDIFGSLVEFSAGGINNNNSSQHFTIKNNNINLNLNVFLQPKDTAAYVTIPSETADPTPAQIEQFTNLLVNSGGFILESTKHNQGMSLSNEYIRENKNNTEKEKFITRHIDSADQDVWRLALMIQKKIRSNKSEEVQEAKLIKQDLQRRGSRYTNIANLGSSGHLESQIMPAYKEIMSGEGTVYEKEKRFHDFYEEIVNNCATAVFISARRTLNEYMNEIEGKVHSIKQFHLNLNEINIYGFGKENKEMIKQIYAKVGEKKKKWHILELRQTPDVNNIKIWKLTLVIDVKDKI